MTIPTILDVEASGSGPGSYPIEVGVATGDGKTHCFLIKPAAQWLHWDDTEEANHQLSRDILLAAGKEPQDVALSLNTILKGQVVYCEKWGMAMTWMSLLYYSARVPQLFTIEALQSLARRPAADTWNRLRQEVLMELNPQRRRASTDALVLQRTYLRSLQT